jgi:hypothetical protein
MPEAFKLHHFDDFLQLAQQQPVLERLLFVLTQRVLPKGATEAEVQQFETGIGGVFLPVTGFDLMPDEMTSFAQLMIRLEDTQDGWDLLFVAPHIEAPENPETTTHQALEHFMWRIEAGDITHTLAFDTEGIPVLLEPAGTD